MNTLESIADDVAGFICDEICWACKENLKQDELEDICSKCQLKKHILNIQNYEKEADKKEKILNKKIQHIADTYGYEAQSNQLQEEAAELIQAVNKLRRANGNGQPCQKSEYQATHELIEELADVEIMIQQIVHLLDCKVIFKSFMEDKVSRTLLRMGKEH